MKQDAQTLWFDCCSHCTDNWSSPCSTVAYDEEAGPNQHERACSEGCNTLEFTEADFWEEVWS